MIIVTLLSRDSTKCLSSTKCTLNVFEVKNIKRQHLKALDVSLDHDLRRVQSTSCTSMKARTLFQFPFISRLKRYFKSTVLNVTFGSLKLLLEISRNQTLHQLKSYFSLTVSESSWTPSDKHYERQR